MAPVEELVAALRLAEQLSAASDLGAACKAIAAVLRDGLGASALVLSIADGDDHASLVPLVVEGVSERSEERLAGRVPLDRWPPAQTAFVENRPIFWSSVAERDQEYPQFDGYPSLAESWAVLPLTLSYEPGGILAIGWPSARRFDEVQRTSLLVLAHQCAVALDRARIDEMRRAERRTLELLSEGTRLMVSALDPQVVLDELVRLAVPRLAPWCAVYVAEGDVLRRVAIRVHDEFVLTAKLRNRRALSVHGPEPLAVCYRNGETLVAPVDPGMVRTMYPREQAEAILARNATWTAMTVPIRAGGEIIGAMSLVSRAWDNSPPETVRFAAEGLAGRAGVALNNARRFDAERRIATSLMGAVLPTRLPTIPGYEVAARYLPAGADVAGDWFDVFALPDGRQMLGIGDVGGHGLGAGSLMGQLRNTAKGLALTGHRPSAILDGLSLVTQSDSPEAFATALYAVVDPSAHALRWANAGHLPPLVIDRGTAAYLERRPEPALGWPSAPRTEHTITLSTPGDGLVIFTDGVVEDRSSGLADGMGQLLRLVSSNVDLAAEDLVDRIATLCTSAEDDCCFVVVRRR